MAFRLPVAFLLLTSLEQTGIDAADKISPASAKAAMRKSVDFHRKNVSASGGYLWRFSPDLKMREGERKAGEETAWVQPPGTPTVGQAYLDAYRLCGERYLLDAAKETGYALVQGQLHSGGWDYRIEFNPKQRTKYNYRVNPVRENARNVTTLDDDNTQSALRFLMRLDQQLNFRDKKIHSCVEYALHKLLQAQYPNGAWPQ